MAITLKTQKDLFMWLNAAPIQKKGSKKLKRILLIPKDKSVSGKDVYCYFINNQYAFLLQDIADYAGKNYQAAKRQFNNAKKLYNKFLKRNYLEEHIHYIKVPASQIQKNQQNFGGENFSPSKKIDVAGIKRI